LRVFDRSGAVIVRVPNPGLWVGSRHPEFELLENIKSYEEGISSATGLDNVQRLYGYTTLPSDPQGQIIVAVGIPLESAYRNINNNLLRNLIAIGSLALLGMAMSWIITERFILRPATILTTTSRRLTNGDLSARTHLGVGGGELFELGQDFDQMADALQKQEAQARAMNQELEQRVLERTQELSESRDLLQQFSNHLQNVLEEERKKISREIHDELGQALTGLKMDLRYIKKHLHPDQESIAQRIDTSLQLVDSTITTMRRISSDLRPGILDDLGIVPAVDWLVSNFQNRTGIEVMLNVEPPNLEIPKEMHTSLYRIVQEALTNVMRHAQATQVKIKIEGRPQEVVIEVRDNGRGFDPNTLGHTRSLGLTGIRERAALIGASAEIIGSPGTGTLVSVHVPINGSETAGGEHYDTSSYRG
jgi:signal transduction histidine kinase